MKLSTFKDIPPSAVFPNVKIEFLTYNPKICLEILRDKNKHNRHLNLTRFEFFRDTFKSGDYIQDGNPVKFDINGDLLDGQHRLKGLSLAKKTFKLLTVSGLGTETFVTLDDYRVRSFADALRILDVSSYTGMASVISKLWYYDNDDKFRREARARAVSHITLIKFMKTLDLEEVKKEYNEIVMLQRITPLCSASHSAFCYMIFKRYYPKKAKDFIYKFFEGYGLEKGSAIQLARSRLIKLNNEGFKYPHGYVIRLLFYVWDFYLRNKIPKKFEVPEIIVQPRGSR